VTTQDASRQRALFVPSKAERVTNFHRETIKSLAEMLAAAGMASPKDLMPHHIVRRIGDGRILTLSEQFTFLENEALIVGSAPAAMAHIWDRARSDSFG
jgi:hypothetical protein